jgi:hypothetical protein
LKGFGSFCEVGVKWECWRDGRHSPLCEPNSLTCSLTRPTGGVARGVDDPQHVDQVIFDDIKDAIGKPGQQGSTNAWQNFGIEAGDLFEAFQLQLESQFKFRAKPGSLSGLGRRKRKSAPARIVFDDFAGQYLDMGQESGEK